MKSKIMLSLLTLLLLTLIGCDSTGPDDEVSDDIITSDITVAPVFFDLENQQYYDTWDIKLSSGNMTYLVATNSSAGVLVVTSGSIDFDNAELPDSGLIYENSAEPIIGDQWMNMSTYNPSDHSIQGDGSIYFIRTASFEWVKLEVVSGSPSQFELKYAILNNDGTFNETESLTVSYTSDSPTYFDFTTSTTTSASEWDIGFSMIPDYSTELSTYMFMPTILLNMDSGVQVAIIANANFSDVKDIPTDGWLEDTYDTRPLAYNGNNMILVYHPEPPYNHKVIVEDAELIYLFNNGTSVYKIMFNEYSSGILSFIYEKM